MRVELWPAENNDGGADFRLAVDVQNVRLVNVGNDYLQKDFVAAVVRSAASEVRDASHGRPLAAKKKKEETKDTSTDDKEPVRDDDGNPLVEALSRISLDEVGRGADGRCKQAAATW